MKLLSAFVLTAALLVVGFKWMQRDYPFGNHQNLDGAKSAEWLPEEATNIYSRNIGALESYEFNISESGFLEWAKGKKLQLEPIVEERSIYKYTYFDGTGKFRSQFQLHKAHAKNGYFQEYHNENGSGLEVLYDKDEKKAYYWWVLR